MKKTPWQASFEALGDALERLEEALKIPLDTHGIVVDATIQRFEFTFELFWKTLKKFMYREGLEVKTPRETLQTAYQLKWIDDEEKWLAMLNDRNETSHIYDEAMAKRIYENIKSYMPLFKATYDHLDKV
ncbi:MAG: nucleotidyltransferase substrate binding protein [Chlamydiales bacterium]|nr:nucleotidyltransferase substrate binding protein [Chlamydiales bacterium]